MTTNKMQKTGGKITIHPGPTDIVAYRDGSIAINIHYIPLTSEFYIVVSRKLVDPQHEPAMGGRQGGKVAGKQCLLFTFHTD